MYDLKCGGGTCGSVISLWKVRIGLVGEGGVAVHWLAEKSPGLSKTGTGPQSIGRGQLGCWKNLLGKLLAGSVAELTGKPESGSLQKVNITQLGHLQDPCLWEACQAVLGALLGAAFEGFLWTHLLGELHWRYHMPAWQREKGKLTKTRTPMPIPHLLVPQAVLQTSRETRVESLFNK